jgi:phage major head subunit gpT-like protein
MTLNMNAASQELVDLGAAPMPVNSASGYTVQDMIERTKVVTPTDWDITVWLSYNAMKDDQTGALDRKVRQAGQNFQKHINKRVFQVLDAGDSQTYGACYDGQDFFDNDHVDKGAAYQTNQDNEGALALSLDNFETTLIACQAFVDDQGDYCEYNYDLMVIPPAVAYTASQICNNTRAYDTQAQEANPYSGQFTYVTSPYIASAAWFLIASNETVKPLILAMREQPNLQDSWFDPKAPDGGRFYFKFFARYEVHYGDWRLAYMGHS